MSNPGLAVAMLGRCDYAPTEAAMRAFTATRGPDTPDALWLVEHAPVFTQGLAGKAEHLLGTTAVPVVQTDRGGQITYHGPGQVVAYPLLDLRRRGYFVKEYVFRIEEAVISTLAALGVTGHRVRTAPGIYVRLADPFGHSQLQTQSLDPLLDRFQGLGKVAALGIKVSRHCSYHGVALNVAMDLAPFLSINPCGYAGLQTVDLKSLGVLATWDETAALLVQQLQRHL